MGDDDITLVSTTDTAEQVEEALVGRPEPEKPADEEPPAADEEAAPKDETPAEKEERKDATTRGAKRKQTIADEINELTRTKHSVRLDVEAEEARLADLRRQREEIEKVAKPAETPAATPKAVDDESREEPKLDAVDDKGDAKYATYEDYLSDHAKWTRDEATLAAKRVVEEARNADRARIEQESANRVVNEHLTDFQSRLEEFKKTHVDFDAAYEDAKGSVQQLMVALGPESMQVIDKYSVFDAEDGPALTYYLLKHQDELKSIAMKAPAQQLIALARLEERIRPTDVKKPGPSSGAAPKTRAPEPIKPVGSAPTATTVPIEEEAYQDYKVRRERELRTRRGA